MTTLALAIVAVVGLLLLVFGAGEGTVLNGMGDGLKTVIVFVILLAAGTFGVTMVLPIGGADMPVVISLLNSFTGTAAAMSGFVLGNPVLIIAGALVGASGAILTKLMADAMNRSILNIMIGGFGGGEGVVAIEGVGGGTVREIGVDDAAIQMAYASKVIVVPGYGLAVAQAQHAVRELAELLEARDVEVLYAIHPVAGRMPGHMNVLLAEANVPYPLLKEMDEINPEFPRADVALVVGANDVTNPAARSNPASPIYGMPILDVDAGQVDHRHQALDGPRLRGHRQRAVHEPQDGHALRRREGRPGGAHPGRQGPVASRRRVRPASSRGQAEAGPHIAGRPRRFAGAARLPGRAVRHRPCRDQRGPRPYGAPRHPWRSVSWRWQHATDLDLEHDAVRGSGPDRHRAVGLASGSLRWCHRTTIEAGGHVADGAVPSPAAQPPAPPNSTPVSGPVSELQAGRQHGDRGLRRRPARARGRRSAIPVASAAMPCMAAHSASATASCRHRLAARARRPATRPPCGRRFGGHHRQCAHRLDARAVLLGAVRQEIVGSR